MSVAVEEEHGGRGPAEEVFVFVVDEHFVDSGGPSGLDLGCHGNQPPAATRGQVVDGGRQGDGIPSGGEAGTAGRGIREGKQGTAVDKSVDVQDVLVNGHFHAGIPLPEFRHAHVVGLQVFAGGIQALLEAFEPGFLVFGGFLELLCVVCLMHKGIVALPRMGVV